MKFAFFLAVFSTISAVLLLYLICALHDDFNKETKKYKHPWRNLAVGVAMFFMCAFTYALYKKIDSTLMKVIGIILAVIFSVAAIFALRHLQDLIAMKISKQRK